MDYLVVNNTVSCYYSIKKARAVRHFWGLGSLAGLVK
jgi:hypothetical protein